MWPIAVLPIGSTESDIVQLQGFTLPTFDESTSCVVKIKSDTYDVDVNLTFEDSDLLSSSSEDLPESFSGYVTLLYSSSNNEVSFSNDGSPDAQYTFKVLSFDHNGQQIYP